MDEQQTKTPADAGSAAPETEPYLFYNVMPKGGGDVVAPKVNVTEAPSRQPDVKTEAPKTAAGRLKIARYLTWAAIIAVLCGIGYFVYQHFAPSVPVSNSPLPIHHATSTPAASSSNSPYGPVTTPAAWQEKYFGSPTCQDVSICGDNADPDRDGLTNIQEYKDGTDPNNPDSDGDGIADGDAINVFLTDPLNAHSGIDPKYSISQSLEAGYNPATDQKYTPAELQALEQRMRQYGLHEPTIATLGDALINIYNFTPSAASSSPGSILNSTPTPPGPAGTPPTATSTPGSPSGSSTVLGLSITGLDESAEGKEDRDAQRTNTIQTIAEALLKYQSVNKTFPATTNFADMYSTVKPYNLIATNPVDPINQSPFVYGYAPSQAGDNFTLSFYSETQNQLIQVDASDAQKYAAEQSASDNDDQRKTDLESLQSALLLYSNANAAGNQDYVFPTQAKYKTALVPQYIAQIPVDPVSGQDYDYEVDKTFDTFTLKAALQNPPTGSTGYMCNQLECGYY
jgi:hypothetical protein